MKPLRFHIIVIEPSQQAYMFNHHKNYLE